MRLNKNNLFLVTLLTTVLITTSFSTVVISTDTEHTPFHHNDMNSFYTTIYPVISKLSEDLPLAIEISDSNPFFALIATPLAVHYEDKTQEIIPLYVKDFYNPSKAVLRTIEQVGVIPDFSIPPTQTPKNASLAIATQFWDDSNTALLIKNDQVGYELGIMATPIASYLSIPIIVTPEVDNVVKNVLNGLGVENVYVCGNLSAPGYNITKLDNINQITALCKTIIQNEFGQTINYITLANPLDVNPPTILDTISYEFNGSINSGCFLPTQLANMIINSGAGAAHEFVMPEDYKYANIHIDVTNLNSEHVEALGDRISIVLVGPDGNRCMFGNTCGGLPERDEEGTILNDRLHYEVAVYDYPGNYTVRVSGQFFASKKAEYHVQITVEKLDSPLVPLMDGLSSLAAYLASYHTGIVYAKSEFAFAADDHIIYNGSTCPGVTQPGTNPNLLEPSNIHTIQIHDEVNQLLADIANIPVENLEELKNHYSENPAYIAITADPTMVPMYFYFNPDGKPDNPTAYMMGFALPSDFIYGDIDPKPDDPENNTFSYWPFQENIVGRVTGRDVQDASALIARTIYYNDIIDDLGDWKNNALVQTGCGLEFQNLPIITRLGRLIGQITSTGRDEPTKAPTAESTFINMRLKEDMERGEYNVKNTFLLQSQRQGFSDEALNNLKQAGLLNNLLFPKQFVYFLSSDEKVTGGEDQLNSSFIFAFAHGSFNLYEFGDVLMDTRGFPFVTPLSRIYPKIRSGLSALGSFDVRSVENMEYGPSVIYVESCITGRTDGMHGENVLSQTYLHAGANAYIGATRVTADPGYLEPRPLPGGLGIGLLGFIKALMDYMLLDKYPDLHFGAVIAEDFILDLLQNNSDVGSALRNAKNMYLQKDANASFLWTPPLIASSSIPGMEDISHQVFGTKGTINDRTPVMTKKYVALHEFTLYGDPAFNPYQPINNG